MRVVSEQAQLRKKSAPSSIYLHIPYLNAVFFFFIMRGAYTLITSKYYQDKKLPSILVTIGLSVKVSFLASIWSSIMYVALLALGFNPFGEIAAFYWEHIGDLFSGLFSPDIAAVLFPATSSLLRFATFDWAHIQVAVLFIFLAYIVFGFTGGLLARFNIREDQLRNRFI